jgi:hypothetical protein
VNEVKGSSELKLGVVDEMVDAVVVVVVVVAGRERITTELLISISSS